MQIDIWSDIVCPFCYIGKRHLEKALEGFAQRDQVSIRWHSFELDPDAPERDDRSINEILAAKYGRSPDQIKEMQQRVIDMGNQAGITLRAGETIRVNSLLAHRMLQLAASYHLQDQAVDRLMRAYFTELEDLSDGESLVRLLNEIGLSEELVRDAIDSGAFEGTVRDDERAARQIGISGVPFFIFNDKYAISGAQPPEVFSQVLEKAWTEQQTAKA